MSRKPSEAKRERIAPLSILPVFFNLQDKPALVVGGTEAACWKAELLAAAGAKVTVIAQSVTDVMQTAIDTHAMTHHRRTWAPSDFQGVSLVIADLQDADDFYAAATAARLPVNVIDNPQYCSFQFGSIVNRSPVVVGISTTGSAPILGQSIRQKIETLLPKGLANWAQLAKDGRQYLAANIPDAAQRRTIWERFVDKAWKADAPADAIRAVNDLIYQTPASSGGKVTLVGAGPGAADLLTLKAVRALQSADVILFDDLISDDVLELARREAKRMLVGKRGGRASCKQEDINALMLKLAKQGRHVVRLKSGDPMIFGRAGEEIEMLESAGVAVSVVPGITSALAAASAAKISLTHRDHAQSVRFVTGHSRKGEVPDLDWDGLADNKTTLMVYMGGRTAKEFCQRLLGRGLPSLTPVKLFSDLGRDQQAIEDSTVGELAQNGCGHGESPLLIGIGSALAASQTCERRLQLQG